MKLHCSEFHGQHILFAGTIVELQHLHHVPVGHRAAHGVSVPDQLHGVDGGQPFDQALIPVFVLVEGDKAHHALNDTGAQGVRVTFPRFSNGPQALGVDVWAVLLEFLEGGADADDLVACADMVGAKL